MGPAVDEKQWKTDLDYLRDWSPGRARVSSSAARSPSIWPKATLLSRRFSTTWDRICASLKKRFSAPCYPSRQQRIWRKRFSSPTAVEYGLTTSIFTENIDTIMNFVEEVETGMIHVNEPTIGGEAQLPFGGTKATGVGEREMAEEGLNFFTELKTVFINYSGKAERLMIR